MNKYKNKQRRNTPRKKPRVSREFIENYPAVAASSYGVTAERLARVVDNIGLTALHYALRYSTNVPDLRFKHLLLAEKHMPKPIVPGPNFHAFYQSTPLEVAVKYGKLPADTTKEMLQRVKTRHGSGWDSVISRVKCRVAETQYEVGEARFRVARTYLEKFPELITCLHPLRREYDAQLLGGDWGTEYFLQRSGSQPASKDLLVFLLQVHPKAGLAALEHYGTLTDRPGLMALLLQGRLPAVRGFDAAAIQERQIVAARRFAEHIRIYPALAAFLNPNQPLHEKIFSTLIQLSLTAEQRSALAKHPAMCAALL